MFERVVRVGLYDRLNGRGRVRLQRLTNAAWRHAFLRVWGFDDVGLNVVHECSQSEQKNDVSPKCSTCAPSLERTLRERRTHSPDHRAWS